MPTILPNSEASQPYCPQSPPAVRVGLLGETADVEFDPFRSTLTERMTGPMANNAEIETVSFSDAVTTTGSSRMFDLLIVWQTWPDQFSPGDVQKIISRFPLTRILVVFGPWCRSDGRTRHAWPVALRVSHDEFWLRLQQEIGVIRGTFPPLPPTASRSETFGWSINASAPASSTFHS